MNEGESADWQKKSFDNVNFPFWILVATSSNNLSLLLCGKMFIGMDSKSVRSFS